MIDEVFTTILRDGKPADFFYIDSLRKREANALGFIPKLAYETVLEGRPLRDRDAQAYRNNRILVTEDNGDLTGFCYALFGQSTASITQIVVQDDARRWHRALLMADEVQREAEKRYCTAIKCRVAFDLESNHFWRAIGYEPIKQVTSTWLNQKESKSKRPLILYRKELTVNSLFALIA